LVILILLGPYCSFGEETRKSVPETLFHHILNSPEMELFPNTPALQLPSGWTVHQVMLVLTVFLISLVFVVFTRKGNLNPGKILLSLESLVLFVREDIVHPIMGKEEGDKWLPFFTSLFLFILTLNVLGLIPAFKTATGNINVTMSLAFLVLLLTFVYGFKGGGLVGFFKNLYPQGAPGPIGVFVFFLEFLSLFTKSAVLGLRLFVNMFAGHMAILSFLILIFVITPLFGFISVPFAVFTYALEVLIAFIQALVFTLLSCIFISMARSH